MKFLRQEYWNRLPFSTPTIPSLASVNLLEQFTELRLLVYSLDYRFIKMFIKDMHQQPIEEMHIARYGRKAQSFCSHSQHTTLLASPCINQPRSLNPVLLDIMEVSIHRHG